MRWPGKAFSSARTRLIFWNTVTFAIVLIALAIVFRVMAERSLLTSLDREMAVQAGRFRDTRQIAMVFVGESAPKGSLETMVVTARKTLHTLSPGKMTTHYKMVTNLSATAPDRSGQFLYRSFDLTGRPLSPVQHLPFRLSLSGEDSQDGDPLAAPDYKPWHLAGFRKAVRGLEPYGNVTSGGTQLRILSVPLRQDDRIVGVAQIAAPLKPLQRDIAGLTHPLLWIVPASLMVAVLAGMFLTDRALRPVKELTRAAAAIRPDQLARRLPVSGTDEFDELASTFNGALGRVQTAFLDRERAIAQLRRFTADASHELRTPLTTIKMNTGVALTEGEPSQEHVHALKQIDRAADRMTALVQDLLLLARSDSGQLALDLAAVSLADIAADAIEGLPPEPHAPISVKVQGPEPIICGDHEQLRRLFLNLLQNATRYTPLDGRIAIEIDSGRSRVTAAVSDNGCGIAAEHLPNIGQPFYRADGAGRNRKHGGAGLGLAICRSIAAAHGAVVDLQSQVGRGTTVTLSFPSATGSRIGE